MGLLWAITAHSPVSANLAADGGLMNTYNLGNIGLVMLGFQQGGNLVSLLLGKLRIGSHLCFSFLPERKAAILSQLALHSELLSCTYKLNPPFDSSPILRFRLTHRFQNVN